jgi:hypothetical protein
MSLWLELNNFLEQNKYDETYDLLRNYFNDCDDDKQFIKVLIELLCLERELIDENKIGYFVEKFKNILYENLHYSKINVFETLFNLCWNDEIALMTKIIEYYYFENFKNNLIKMKL